jgi:hypothetical protein
MLFLSLKTQNRRKPVTQSQGSKAAQERSAATIARFPQQRKGKTGENR